MPYSYFTDENKLRTDFEDQEEPRKIETPSNNQAAQKAAANAFGSSGGSMMNKGGNALTSAGIASGNPYLLAGGLAMGVMADNKQKERQEAEAKALAENQRRANLQNSMSQAAQLFSRFRI